MERFVEADGRADLMNIREKQEQTEMELLSPYATQSIRTKGRKKPEVECEIGPVSKGIGIGSSIARLFAV